MRHLMTLRLIAALATISGSAQFADLVPEGAYDVSHDVENSAAPLKVQFKVRSAAPDLPPEIRHAHNALIARGWFECPGEMGPWLEYRDGTSDPPRDEWALRRVWRSADGDRMAVLVTRTLEDPMEAAEQNAPFERTNHLIVIVGQERVRIAMEAIYSVKCDADAPPDSSE